MEQEKVITRQEQKIENTWKMEDLYASAEEFSAIK